MRASLTLSLLVIAVGCDDPPAQPPAPRVDVVEGCALGAPERWIEHAGDRGSLAIAGDRGLVVLASDGELRARSISTTTVERAPVDAGALLALEPRGDRYLLLSRASCAESASCLVARVLDQGGAPIGDPIATALPAPIRTVRRAASEDGPVFVAWSTTGGHRAIERYEIRSDGVLDQKTLALGDAPPSDEEPVEILGLAADGDLWAALWRRGPTEATTSQVFLTSASPATRASSRRARRSPRRSPSVIARSSTSTRGASICAGAPRPDIRSARPSRSRADASRAPRSRARVTRSWSRGSRAARCKAEPCAVDDQHRRCYRRSMVSLRALACIPVCLLIGCDGTSARLDAGSDGGSRTDASGPRDAGADAPAIPLSIECGEPSFGAMIEASAGDAITFDAVVDDPTGEAEVTVDGEAATVTAGHVVTTVIAREGVQSVIVRATRSDRTFAQQCDFLVSPSYADPSAAIASATRTLMRAEALDDGDGTSSFASLSDVVTRALEGTVVELVAAPRLPAPANYPDPGPIGGVDPYLFILHLEYLGAELLPGRATRRSRPATLEPRSTPSPDSSRSTCASAARAIAGASTRSGA